MVPCVNFSVAPAAAIVLSVVIVLSCYMNQLAPYLSYANFTSPFNLSSQVPAAPAPNKCDIFRGEWVPDPDLPQYTNATCNYIYGNQDCLLHSRPDLGYLKWSWKPDGCDLPRFDPQKFLQVVTNKTFAFVGDSLTRNHYQSLLCLLSKVCKIARPPFAFPSFSFMLEVSRSVMLAGSAAQGHCGGSVRSEQSHILRGLQLHHPHHLDPVPGEDGGGP
jgi:hypothetical protein